MNYLKPATPFAILIVVLSGMISFSFYAQSTTNEFDDLTGLYESVSSELDDQYLKYWPL